METVIGVGHPLAVKKWSASLAIDVNKKAYFTRKFTRASDNAIIQQITDLESDAGDTIVYDLSMQLRQKPIEGDALAKGNEEALRFYQDELKIDQMRHPVNAGGRMTRKRTLHNLRSIAKARMSEYWAKYQDELMFCYLSGARGINPEFIQDTAWTGRAGNPLQAPDSAHLMYGGDATSKASVASDDVMSRITIEEAEVVATMMRANDPTTANMQPVDIDGEGRYAIVMSPLQEHSLRTASSSEWVDFQKAAAGAEGRSNPLFKGGLGMIKNTVLHSHPNVIRFSDYGAGSNLPAARALFLGRQAGVIAYGVAGGSRFMWEEEPGDYKNQINICSGTIVGQKKTRFNGKDFGVIAIDTYAATVS